jgi:transposase
MVLLTERRTKIKSAHTMMHVVEMYRDAEVIPVVLEKLNTHKTAALYEAFPPEEASAIARNLDFHYTPKHGSWLNMVETEFSVLSRTCLGGRVPDEATFRRRVNANVAEPNCKHQPINWRFAIRDARNKLRRLYPSTAV